MIRRLTNWLSRRHNRLDPALDIPRDPRDPHHDPRQGWACPAIVGGSECGRPKAPWMETCRLSACRAWATKRRKKEERAGEAVVVAFERGRG